MIGNKITRFSSLDSTNNYVAKQLLAGQYSPGEVILAHFQTNGRGRRGRFWQSEPGENLTFSFAVDTDFLPDHQNFVLSKAISVALFSFLSKHLQADISIKWPNDMLVSGQKIAGMLIENKHINEHKISIVGIGININQIHFPKDLKATSIALELNQKISPNGLIDQVLNEINTTLEMVQDDNFDSIDERYIHHLYGFDRWIEFEENAGRFFGQIRAVDDAGVLVVRSKQGRAVSYHSNEVRIRY